MGNFAVFTSVWLAVGAMLLVCTAPPPTQGRAVNISNTWTLPQEGYSVFYRFFRDKISWFEADAVCQFHHANLVTVANGVQFDAARAFLKELDVTELVWIGLMRPQSAAHFGWSNAKQTMDPASGYWADPIPVMETPLCAVIDPVRDYRWHALRCGGPETAAFLCEMEVPAWAMECTIGSLPSLTFQYMSDSGTVELSRDCGEEGTRHVQCHGQRGVERERILNELRCADETSDAPAAAVAPFSVPTTATDNSTAWTAVPETTATAVAAGASSVTTEQASARTEVLTFVHSDTNEEDNSIAIDVTSLQRVHELMQADGPPSHEFAAVATPAKPKAYGSGPVKKVQPNDWRDKKPYSGKAKVLAKTAVEELMMGDQPAELQPLPHVKKSMHVDGNGAGLVRTTAQFVATTTTTTSQTPTTTTTIIAETTSEPGQNAAVTLESRLRRETVESIRNTDEVQTQPDTTSPQTHTEVDTTTIIATTTTTTTTSATPTTVVTHDHNASQNVDTTHDHFIPPLLMVRTQFVQSTTQQQAASVAATTASATIAEISSSSSSTTITTTPEPEQSTGVAATETTVAAQSPETEATTTTSAASITTQQATVSEEPAARSAASISPETETETVPATMTTTTTEAPTEAPTEAETTTTITTTTSSSSPTTSNIGSHLPHAPHAQQRTGATNSVTLAVSPSTAHHPVVVHEATVTATQHDAHQQTDAAAAAAAGGAVVIDAQHKSPMMTAHTVHNVTATVTSAHAVGGDSAAAAATPAGSDEDSSTSADSAEVDGDTAAAAAKTSVGGRKHGDLTNAENYQPYRPNRRRALTKPETHTYMKKLFG